MGQDKSAPLGTLQIVLFLGSAVSVLAVFVSFEPAELIQLQGEPAYASFAGTSLLWVSNTESDLFRMKATGTFLLSLRVRCQFSNEIGKPTFRL